MLGELPKLFGKAFAIGYLLPAVTICVALFGVLSAYDRAAWVGRHFDTSNVLGASLAAVAVWLVAIALMALNRPLIRLLEGYGDFNPLRLFASSEEFRFRILSSIVQDEANAGYRGALMTLAREFPHEERWLLPTRFGNAIRAFEVYPGVVYGLEGIDGWNRLLAVIPADFRNAIEDARALVSFWVHLWAGSLLTLGLHVALGLVDRHWPDPWIAGLAIATTIGAATIARVAAQAWGGLVMSAFDRYRGELEKALGFDLPRSVKQEREMWRKFSQVMVYRSGHTALDLTRFRRAPGRKR
jgi:hypothetical protein